MYPPIKTLSALALGLLIAGCVSTQEILLAPNFVRLDTHAPFTSEAASQTVRRAAELTLLNGYTHFRLTPMYWTTGDFGTDVGATVVMFHAGEAGARGAFDARTVLASYSQ